MENKGYEICFKEPGYGFTLFAKFGNCKKANLEEAVNAIAEYQSTKIDTGFKPLTNHYGTKFYREVKGDEVIIGFEGIPAIENPKEKTYRAFIRIKSTGGNMAELNRAIAKRFFKSFQEQDETPSLHEDYMGYWDELAKEGKQPKPEPQKTVAPHFYVKGWMLEYPDEDITEKPNVSESRKQPKQKPNDDFDMYDSYPYNTWGGRGAGPSGPGGK